MCRKYKRFKEGLILILRKCCNFFSKSIPVGSPECWITWLHFCPDWLSEFIAAVEAHGSGE